MGNAFLLTLGALIILSLFTLTANGLINDNMTAAEQNEYYLTALSLGQSLIHEAKTKSFDQVTDTSAVLSPLSLTPVSLLGPESGEFIALPDSGGLATGYHSSTAYNDVDDYNGYVRIVNTPRAEGYRVTSYVQYASPTWPDSASGVATFCKEMTVTITSPYLSQPVIVQYAFFY
jgi:hypothetical protein